MPPAIGGVGRASAVVGRRCRAIRAELLMARQRPVDFTSTFDPWPPTRDQRSASGARPAHAADMVRTRLDVVVAVREREEEKAKVAVAKAEALVQAARARASEAKAKAQVDHRARSDASSWELTELAHHRAMADARKAEKEAEAAQKQAEHVRVKLTSAHQRAEVVRRAADSRRTEIVREADRADTKEFDDVASMLHFRKVS